MSKMLLLVDDEALIAMSEAQMLKNHGYEVLTAYNAQKAIETVEESNIDLILMDIDLGDGKMDGTEAAEIILKDHDIPVVFLSSHTEPEVVEKTEGITSYGYIVKNSGETVILASIKMAFRLFEAKQQIREREEASIEEKERLKEYVGIIEERKRIDEQQNKHLLELYEKMDSPQDDLLDYVLNASLEITNSRFAFTGLLNEDESVMTIHRWSKEAMNNCSVSDKPIAFPIEEAGIWGDCIRERQPVIINDYETDTRPTKHGTPEGHVEINCFLCTPIFEGNTIVAVGAVANKTLPYEIADADALAFLYDKMWSLLKQRETDRLLQESEKKFRSIYEESPIGIELYNANGELIEVNQSCLDIFGVTDADQLKGFNLFDDPNVTKEQKEKLRNKEKVMYEVAFELNKVKQIHLYDTRKSGIMYLNVMITPLLEKKENEARGYLVQVVDLTERKRVEEKLKESNKFFDLFFHESLDGFFFMMPDEPIEWNDNIDKEKALDYVFSNQRITKVNDAMLQQYGAKKEDFINLTPNDFFAHNLEHGREVWKRFFDEGKLHIDTTEKKLDGTDLIINGSYTLLYDEKGRITGHFGVQRDVTEERKIERALKESEEKYRLLFNYSNDAIFIHEIGEDNLPGRIIEVNEQACRLLQYSREDFLQKSVKDIAPENNHSLMLSKVKELIEKKHLTFRSEQLRSDGVVIPVEVSAFLYTEGNKKLVVSSVRDITERNIAQEEIQKQLYEKETLLREVHHRLKNNIATIESLLSLQAGSTVNAEVKAALQNAISHVQSMRVLYEKLLLSKEIDEISIKNYAESLIDSLVIFFDPENNIIIEKHIADFEIDAKKAVSIGIIINELLTNVFKYAFEDREKDTIAVSIEKVENKVTLIIQDNGIGTDERIIENKSPGFGLTIVKMLVEQLEGAYSSVNENGTKSFIQFEI